MKRTCLNLALLLFSVSVLQAQPSAPQTKTPEPQQPVYLYLYADVADQINLDITENRLRHLLPMIERLRSAHPEAHVMATILFSGAVSQALEARNAKTHIKDYILDYKKRGLIEVGYDGTDEPTYEHRPMVNLAENRDPKSRWLIRAAEDEKFLTEARDPVTGTPIPGAVGGLDEMQRVFGEAACIRGASVGTSWGGKVYTGETGATPSSGTASGTTPGKAPSSLSNIRPEVGDWEIVPVLQRHNNKAVMFGIPEVNPANIPGFKTSALDIGGIESPVPNSSPELYWSDNLLHTSEWSGGGKPIVRTIHGYEGADAVKEFTTGITRSRIQIVHMELASEKDYLKADFVKAWTAPTSSSPSLAFAYAHPDSPKLPAEARLSADEVNAIYAKEDAALKWLAGDYLPATEGSRFVSNSDLERMTQPSTGFSISVAALQAALSDMLAKWGNNTFPPSYLLANGHYLSLAEMFQVMTDSLAELDRTGKLPQSVKVVRVYGPGQMVQGHGPNIGDVSVASIVKQCSQLAPVLHDEKADPMPHNMIPPGVLLDGIAVNSAQFVRLMAQAMVSTSPEAKLRVRMTYMFPAVAEVYPKTRPMEDVGATWTFKPAPLEVGVHTTQASH